MTYQGSCIAYNPFSLVESTGIKYRGHINLKWSNLTNQKSLKFGFLEITMNLKKYHIEFGPGMLTLAPYKTYKINKWSFHNLYVRYICTRKWLFYIVKCQKCCFQQICLSTFLAPGAYLMVHMAQYTLEFHGSLISFFQPSFFSTPSFFKKKLYYLLKTFFECEKLKPS